MIALVLAKQIATLFFVMLVGFIVVKAGLLKSSDSRVVTIMHVYMGGPAVMITAFQIDYTPEVRNGFLLALASALIIHLIMAIAVAIMKRPLRLTAIERASLIYPNAGNLIFPLVLAIFGKEWLIYASAFLLVQQFLLWSVCLTTISGEPQWNPKKLFRNVNLISITIGLLLFIFHINLPPIVMNTCDLLSDTYGPTAMILVGMLLADVKWGDLLRNKRLYLITFLRMIALPTGVILIMKALNLSALVAGGATIIYITLMTAMSASATTVTVQAQLYDKDPVYASQINIFTTLCCIVTMPIMTLLYQI